MAEFLHTEEQIIRHRIEHAMQGWQRYAELQIDALHARMDAVLVHDQAEGFYGALDGMQQDGHEHSDVLGLAQLHDRLDEMQQAREHEQERSHDHGMGF
jgi:hypothetical protein